MGWLPFGSKKDRVNIQSDELPVPTCLKPYFVPIAGKCSMTELSGGIRCSCGANSFRAIGSEEPGLRYRLCCTGCGQDVLLFDAWQHGWDALVCGVLPEDGAVPEHAESCGKCGGDAFRADVWIEPVEREEFVSDIPEGLTEADWVNAYTWFAATLTCARCGRRVRDWADVETG